MLKRVVASSVDCCCYHLNDVSSDSCGVEALIFNVFVDYIVEMTSIQVLQLASWQPNNAVVIVFLTPHLTMIYLFSRGGKNG